MYTTKTLDVLLQAMVTDLEDVYHNGIDAACPEFPLQLFIAYRISHICI